ncbi:MAG: signal recognition particle receptor subunit alpha [Candidatus Pacearchaeota archaeon]
MVLEKIGSAFKNAISKLTETIFIDKKLIDDIIKEIQRALLEADVNVELVFQLSEKIRKTAIEEKSTLEKKEHLIKLIHDELVNILGKEKHELKLKNKEKMMFLGLYGSGKTTTIAKLANYYAKRGFKVAILGLDTHRPAASEQIEQLAKQIKIPVFVNKTEKNPIKIWNQFSNQLEKYDIIMIDTAGRDVLDNELIKEIKDLKSAIRPDDVILVMPADIGQAAKKQASEFQKIIGISGVIITRMDGTAKGGGVLTACNETNAPVLFIGTGEHINDIEIFNPTAFVSRMLGMGDIESLIEKARLAISNEEKEKLEKRLEEGKFTLLDLYEQLKTMQSMGPLGKIAEMIPGMGKIKIPENLISVQEEKLKKFKYAIDSMTKEEIENPEIITGTRIARIAKGSNISSSDVRELLSQYKLIKSFYKQAKNMQNLDISKMSKKQMIDLAKKFKGKFKF